ncbi:Hint domain-containing protein [Ruegeria arenilitoris]|uniref:Hint domain-containing protein n=1 Tax=Ruegeria arenilitoris TaxID=1173585 RepID=UPI00147CBC94|nr:Hint domain-containing protein [Ruegeria arenilitoris]
MAFDVLLHTVHTTGPGNLVVQNTTEPAIVDGNMISFDGGFTFQSYEYLGQGTRESSGESGEFIEVNGQIYAWDTNDPTGPMSTGNWKITEGDLNPDNPPCFVAGTLIETETGSRLVEELTVGDKVCVSNGQTLPIIWIGKRTLSAQILHIQPKFRPVLIKRDALGKAQPDRDLYVSPQHRIVIEGWRAELLFGEPMVFSAAIHLVNDDTIRQVKADEPVTYFHIACERHTILTSHGLRSESLYLGDRVLNSFGREDVDELREIFPELNGDGSMQQTRLRCLKRPEAQALQGMFPQ